jgi:coenzyme PQQ precursor peptide PqqA
LRHDDDAEQFLHAWTYPRSKRRYIMAWKKPRIVEVPVSMEVTMYFCATRK